MAWKNKPTQPYNISVLFGTRKRPSFAGSPLSVLSLLFICFSHVWHSCSHLNHMRHTYFRRLGDQGSLTGVNWPLSQWRSINTFFYIAKYKRVLEYTRGILPYKRLMGMCRWMGSHFFDWIDYNGVAFSIALLEWGRTFSDFLEVRQFFSFTVTKRTRMLVL